MRTTLKICPRVPSSDAVVVSDIKNMMARRVVGSIWYVKGSSKHGHGHVCHLIIGGATEPKRKVIRHKEVFNALG